MTKVSVARTLSFGLALAAFSSVAFAERVNICGRQTFSQASGDYCSYTTKPGEVVTAWANYRDTSPDSANIWLDQLGGVVNVPANQQRLDAVRIYLDQVKSTKVQFNIPNFASGDYLDLELYSDRSNLQVLPPYIESTTGDMVVPWSVNTNSIFVPVTWVGIDLWGNSAWQNFDQRLGTLWLDACVNRGNCSSFGRIPFNSRVAIDRGRSWLAAKIDPGNNHAETNEDDGDNRSVKFLDDFFVENVPNIMRGHASSWTLAGTFLDRWFDLGRCQKSAESGAGIDWKLDIIIPTTTDWFLQPQNASNNRIIQKFNQLISPSYFDKGATRTNIRTRIINKFQLNPSATSVSLSDGWQSGHLIKKYHEQQITYIEGQAGGIYGDTSLDAVTASFGGFSFYLVPIGTAVKEDSSYFRVTITKVEVYVLDSFDFEGEQPLGCWGDPGRVSALPGSGLQCISNSAYRYYRHYKARGCDHNIFTTPKVVNVVPPLSYRLRRP